MSAAFTISDDIKARQRRAADPSASVWVSANAGAGKTKVLTDRVIRILLAGTAPSRILCLTFTKAAAAEMTIRVFETLGDWVTMPEPDLRAALLELTGERPGRTLCADARRLFARAVETPGGLKIETIHAFCERLLHLVPFEAGVPAGFEVMDDARAGELMTMARDAVLAQAASGEPRHAGLAAALETVAALAAGPRLPQLLTEAVADRRIPDDPAELDATVAALAEAFRLGPDDTVETVRRRVLEDGLPPSEWPALAAAIGSTGKSADRTTADILAMAARASYPAGRLAHYWSVFFTDKDTPRDSVGTKSVDAALRDRLQAEQERLVALRPALLGAEAVERSRALFRLAGAVRRRIASVKARLGALDFDDLIRATLALLERGEGEWVLYRLDRGIDHVLIDEAQDTNPEQWAILRRLTQEFTAGAGRPGRGTRTVFVVGDPKQSIYAFQGADPREFEDSRNHWRDRHKAARIAFHEVGLDLSFRSAQLVLDAVDATFALPANYRGLGLAGDPAIGTRHTAARQGAPGRVEVWPAAMPEKAAGDDDAWALPVDLPGPDSPAVQAAERVARAVAGWIRDGDGPGTRVWRPGEILVLARKRGPAFFAVIRALKSLGVPVAGADRIDIGEQIAVNDLVAAGGAALLPQNDLVLAAALKSPLVGLDDDDLIRIAADRPDGQSLHAALGRAAEGGDARAGAALARVTRWQDLARTRGPFGFFAVLLGPDGGRRRLVERLGGEAADALDVFLSEAAADEFGPETSSLTAFLARFEAAAHVVRRDPEAAGDQVRVMTVHGAKGLEAELVVLLDGCDVGGRDPALIAIEPGDGRAPLPVWALAAATDPPALAEARQALKGRAQEEHNRLLYVALTRARDRLVLVPFTDGRGGLPKPETWCEMVRAGFAGATRALVRAETVHGPADIVHDTVPVQGSAGDPAPSAPDVQPAWLSLPAEPESDPLPPLRPSGALAAADRADLTAATGRDQARARGLRVHGLIEQLADARIRRPEIDLDRLAAETLAASPEIDPIERAGMAAEALGVLRHPDLAALFGPGSRGEVSLSGTVGPPGREREVVGRVDRLASLPAGPASSPAGPASSPAGPASSPAGPASSPSGPAGSPAGCIVADFKTGSPPAAGAPDAYLAQLALYGALLERVDPQRPVVRTLLVWTQGPVVVEPPPAALAAALDRALAALA